MNIYDDTGWGIVRCTAVIVAVAADRVLVVFVFCMTVDTINLDVYFVELQAHYCMLKILVVPAGMTIDTVFIQPADAFPGWVAGAAVECIVIPVESPTGGTVRETRFFSCIMTFHAA